MSGWAKLFVALFIILLALALGWITYTQVRARQSGLPAPTWRAYIPFLKSRSAADSSFGGGVPSPRSAGPLEWIKTKISTLRHGRNRTAQGNYEESGGYGGAGGAGGAGQGTGLTGYTGAGGSGAEGGRRARGMDTDEAWDTRVGNEGDSYGGGGGGGGPGTAGSGYYEDQLAPTPGLDDHFAVGPQKVEGSGLPAYNYNDDAERRGRSRSRDPDAQQSSKNPFGDENEAPSLRGISPRPVLEAGEGRGKSRGGEPDSPTSRKSMFRESL